MMTSFTSETPAPNTTTKTKQQVNQNIELSPRKFVNDDLSSVPLLKILLRRKLSMCLQQINTGKYRPKATNTLCTDQEDDSESGAPQPKKQRLNNEEECRWKLTKIEKEAENDVPPAQQGIANRKIC